MSWGRAAVALGATFTTLAGTPTSATSEPPVDAVGDVRWAKLGLLDFVTDHVDRPDRIDEPCPTVDASARMRLLNERGLTLSQQRSVVVIDWPDDRGDGLVVVECGHYLWEAAEPAGSVRLSVEAAVLDGQLSFAEYAVALGGNDVDIARDDSGVDVVVRCTNGGRDCTAAVHRDGLLVAVGVRGLPDGGEPIAADLARTLWERGLERLAERGREARDG